MASYNGDSVCGTQRKARADLANVGVEVVKKASRLACGHKSTHVYEDGQCQICGQFGGELGECSFCGKPAIGRCTHEYRGQVCEWHYLVAGTNGFLPVRKGSVQPLLPEQAAEIISRLKD